MSRKLHNTKLIFCMIEYYSSMKRTSYIRLPQHIHKENKQIFFHVHIMVLNAHKLILTNIFVETSYKVMNKIIQIFILTLILILILIIIIIIILFYLNPNPNPNHNYYSRYDPNPNTNSNSKYCINRQTANCPWTVEK